MKEHLGGGTHKKGHDLRRVFFCDKVPQYRYFKFSSGFAPAVAPAVNCILMSRNALKLEIQKS